MNKFSVRAFEVVLVLGLVWMLTMVSGCNTVNGIGRDFQTMSDNYIQDSRHDR